MASTRVVEAERGTYAGRIRPQHNGYWAGDFSAGSPVTSGVTSGATRPHPVIWR